MGEYESLVELFKRISEISPGPSPNEGFDVSGETPYVPPLDTSNFPQWPEWRRHISGGPLGMSQGSMTAKSALGDLQGAGVRPPISPANQIWELIQLVTKAQAAQQQGVQAPAAPGQQQTGTVGGSRNLLQELLGGMHE